MRLIGGVGTEGRGFLRFGRQAGVGSCSSWTGGGCPAGEVKSLVFRVELCAPRWLLRLVVWWDCRFDPNCVKLNKEGNKKRGAPNCWS